MKTYPYSFWLLCLSLFIAPLIAKAETSPADAEQYWSSLAQNTSNDLVTRLEAMQNLEQYSGVNSLITVARASRDVYPEMRMAAIRVANQWDDVARWDVVSTLLNDDDLQVQGAAIRSVLPLKAELNESQQRYLDEQVDIFIAKSNANVSFEMAELYISRGDFQQARETLEALNNLEESPEHISLLTSEILWREGNKQTALNYLNGQVEQLKNVAPLYYQMGLMLVAEKRYLDAESPLTKAHRLEPEQPRYLIALATLLQTDSPERAVLMFEKLYQITGLPEHLYSVCYTRLKSELNVESCTNELAAIAPHLVLNEFTQVQ